MTPNPTAPMSTKLDEICETFVDERLGKPFGDDIRALAPRQQAAQREG